MKGRKEETIDSLKISKGSWAPNYSQKFSDIEGLMTSWWYIVHSPNCKLPLSSLPLHWFVIPLIDLFKDKVI